MLANELLTSFEAIEPETPTDIPSEVPTIPDSTYPDNTEPQNPPTDTPAKPSQPSATAVVLDSAGIKITLLAVEYDSFWESYKLKFAIENNSDIDVIITSDEEIVDGYMVDTNIGFYCEILAGKKAVDYLMLYDYALEPLGVTQPSVTEFKWSVVASDDLFSTILETDTVTINIA